jgi:TPP-dependent pyruvate/acetoin dehydrogenase alpha subunit
MNQNRSIESLAAQGLPSLTGADLIAFEEDIAREFNAGHIRAPVHLHEGNEAILIEIFQRIRADDWVLCSWRSHYHCLLKGVPAEQVKREILAGRSIALCFPEYRIVSSAIVTGILPIAVGIAMAIKRQQQSHMVYCFIGDMTSETGMAHECIKYSENHQLPIHFVIEDNGKSVCTDTRAAWNQPRLTYEDIRNHRITYYRYQTRYPHAGAGMRVQF